MHVQRPACPAGVLHLPAGSRFCCRTQSPHGSCQADRRFRPIEQQGSACPARLAVPAQAGAVLIQQLQDMAAARADAAATATLPTAARAAAARDKLVQRQVGLVLSGRSQAPSSLSAAAALTASCLSVSHCNILLAD